MHSHHHASADGLPDFVRHRGWRRALAVAALAALVLGTMGNYQYRQGEPGGADLGNALYQTVQLFILHAPHFERPVPWTLEIARWLAPITILASLVGLARRMFHEEASQQRLRSLRGHVIVCGLGRKGMELVRHLRSPDSAARPAVVVIDKDPQPNFAAECERLKAHLLVGDPTKPESLLEAGMGHAARVFAVCADDATNCEIAVQVARLRKDHMDPRACLGHLGTAELGQTLQHALAVHDVPGHRPGCTRSTPSTPRPSRCWRMACRWTTPACTPATTVASIW